MTKIKLRMSEVKKRTGERSRNGRQNKTRVLECRYCRSAGDKILPLRVITAKP